jgi:hypothetical protein
MPVSIRVGVRRLSTNQLRRGRGRAGSACIAGRPHTPAPHFLTGCTVVHVPLKPAGSTKACAWQLSLAEPRALRFVGARGPPVHVRLCVRVRGAHCAGAPHLPPHVRLLVALVIRDNDLGKERTRWLTAPLVRAGGWQIRAAEPTSPAIRTHSSSTMPHSAHVHVARAKDAKHFKHAML